MIAGRRTDAIASRWAGAKCRSRAGVTTARATFVELGRAGGRRGLKREAGCGRSTADRRGHGRLRLIEVLGCRAVAVVGVADQQRRGDPVAGTSGVDARGGPRSAGCGDPAGDRADLHAGGDHLSGRDQGRYRAPILWTEVVDVLPPSRLGKGMRLRLNDRAVIELPQVDAGRGDALRTAAGLRQTQ